MSTTPDIDKLTAEIDRLRTYKRNARCNARRLQSVAQERERRYRKTQAQYNDLRDAYQCDCYRARGGDVWLAWVAAASLVLNILFMFGAV